MRLYGLTNERMNRGFNFASWLPRGRVWLRGLAATSNEFALDVYSYSTRAARCRALPRAVAGCTARDIASKFPWNV